MEANNDEMQNENSLRIADPTPIPATRSPGIENLVEYISNSDGPRVVANGDQDIEEQIRQLKSLQEILDQSIGRLSYALDRRRGKRAADQPEDKPDDAEDVQAKLDDSPLTIHNGEALAINRGQPYIARLRERKRKRSASSRKSEEETQGTEVDERVAKKRVPNVPQFGPSEAFLFGFGKEAKAAALNEQVRKSH